MSPEGLATSSAVGGASVAGFGASFIGLLEDEPSTQEGRAFRRRGDPERANAVVGPGDRAKDPDDPPAENPLHVGDPGPFGHDIGATGTGGDKTGRCERDHSTNRPRCRTG